MINIQDNDLLEKYVDLTPCATPKFDAKQYYQERPYLKSLDNTTGYRLKTDPK